MILVSFEEGKASPFESRIHSSGLVAVLASDSDSYESHARKLAQRAASDSITCVDRRPRTFFQKLEPSLTSGSGGGRAVEREEQHRCVFENRW